MSKLNKWGKGQTYGSLPRKVIFVGSQGTVWGQILGSSKCWFQADVELQIYANRNQQTVRGLRGLWCHQTWQRKIAGKITPLMIFPVKCPASLRISQPCWVGTSLPGDESSKSTTTVWFKRATLMYLPCEMLHAEYEPHHFDIYCDILWYVLPQMVPACPSHVGKYPIMHVWHIDL